ncbi:MAG: HPr family phosphocarrier protein [Clostridiales bacterium]|jgi:phosphocarrier protein|nr:HPr family phosphocarrier protein [Eubacteriales bacterium]MDH7567290.1 HPr family phosphocarrier protein [Clostridiales bacterium]
MIESIVEISNPTGLDARPAALFVKTAGKFMSEIWITKGEKRVNAKSIMGLMSLAVSKGETVTVGAQGEDEEHAVRELVELITTGFGE